MKVPTANDKYSAPRQVRLFRNGANQAIRIPREFELAGTEALIRQVGNTLVIEPSVIQHPKGSLAALLAALGTLNAIEEPFPEIDQELLPLDDVKL